MAATYRLNRVVCFRPGWWNGEYWSPDRVKELGENFRRFSAPALPRLFYQAYASINHDDKARLSPEDRADEQLANGVVTNFDVDPDGTAWADIDNVPESVANAIKAGRLRRPSIEFWDTTADPHARLLAGFPATADGKPPGLILRTVTFLGPKAEGVKGLPDLPMPVPSTRAVTPDDAPPVALAFCDATYRLCRFTESDYMTPEQMMAAITAACPALTAEVLATVPPDAIAKMYAAVSAAPPDEPEAPANTPAAPPADPMKMMNDYAASDAGQKMFQQMFAKQFGDTTGLAAKAEAARKAADHAVATLNRQAEHAAAEAKKLTAGTIKRFLDECQQQGKFRPVDRAAYELMLASADTAAVRKFADKTTDGTELDERMAVIDALPKDPRFARRFEDGTAGASPGAKFDPTRLARIAAGMPGGPKLAKAVTDRLAKTN